MIKKNKLKFRIQFEVRPAPIKRAYFLVSESSNTRPKGGREEKKRRRERERERERGSVFRYIYTYIHTERERKWVVGLLRCTAALVLTQTSHSNDKRRPNNSSLVASILASPPFALISLP